jgi:hypothetical protein
MIPNGPNIRGIARNVSKRYPVSGQVALLEQNGITVIYAEDRKHAELDMRGAWLRSLRNGDVAVVTWLGLLADPVGNVALRRRDLKEIVDEIEEKGASIWELATDRRSTDKKQRDAMIADAWEGLAKARFDKGTASPGRPPQFKSEEDRAIIWDEWHSKQHKTNAEAARAASARLQKIIRPNLMWRIVLEMRAANGLPAKLKGGSGRRAGRREPSLGGAWDKHKSQVYFLQQGETDRVKIGFSCRINGRISNLRSSNPDKLTLLATVSGARDAEARLHKRFSRYRITGEWYRLEGKLAEYVAKLPKPKKPMS